MPRMTPLSSPHCLWGFSGQVLRRRPGQIGIGIGESAEKTSCETEEPVARGVLPPGCAKVARRDDEAELSQAGATSETRRRTGPALSDEPQSR